MFKSVIVARKHDGLPLSASTDNIEVKMDCISFKQLQEGFSDFRSQTKALLLKLATHSENNSIVEFEKYLAQYNSLLPKSIKIVDEIAFICFCEKTSSKNVAFAFLTELSEAFSKMFTESQVKLANRPYALMKFGNRNI